MKITFMKRHLYIGLYWRSEDITEPSCKIHKEHVKHVCRTTWYLCLVPCFPIVWETRMRKGKL